MQTKKYHTQTVTFPSHHELNVVEAGLQLLEVSTLNEMDRARRFEDDDMLALCEIRLQRIAKARRATLSSVRSAEAA